MWYFRIKIGRFDYLQNVKLYFMKNKTMITEKKQNEENIGIRFNNAFSLYIIFLKGTK